MSDWMPPGKGWIVGDAPRDLDYEEVTYRRPLLGTLVVWHRPMDRSDLERQADALQVISDSLVDDD